MKPTAGEGIQDVAVRVLLFLMAAAKNSMNSFKPWSSASAITVGNVGEYRQWARSLIMANLGFMPQHDEPVKRSHGCENQQKWRSRGPAACYQPKCDPDRR
jgi:hypothetical protein